MNTTTTGSNREGSESRAGSTLAIIAIFLAGGVAFGIAQKLSERQQYATFIKHCPGLDIDNHFAFRTSEGRIVIVSFLDIPEGQLPTFCADPKDLLLNPAN